MIRIFGSVCKSEPFHMFEHYHIYSAQI